jgi:hypothetical protein
MKLCVRRIICSRETTGKKIASLACFFFRLSFFRRRLEFAEVDLPYEAVIDAGHAGFVA